MFQDGKRSLKLGGKNVKMIMMIIEDKPGTFAGQNLNLYNYPMKCIPIL